MQTTIENVLRVSPEVFWELFFDPAYNEGLYRRLGFERYDVLELTRAPDGSVRRRLRAEPPMNVPELLKRALKGRIYYTEDGRYDPARGVWEFVNESSVSAGSTQVSGSIRAEPHPEGIRQIVTLDVRVWALGLGSLVERAIEKNTRDSYRLATEYINAYAAERGLSA